MDEQVDHVGVDLWQAFEAYKAAMYAGVADHGFGDVTVADSDTLVLIGPQGIALSDLARRRHVSRQAAHEQVHALVRRGYLEIVPDPDDGRKRLVRRTAKGREMNAAMSQVKRQLHAKLLDRLGPDGMEALRRALALVTHETVRQPLATGAEPE